MVTATKRWRRWCGTREDLLRAIDRAAELVEESTKLKPEIETSVQLKGGINHQAAGTDPIRNLHSKELDDVESIDVTVEVAFSEWREAVERGQVSDEDRPRDRVSIKINDFLGVSLQVQAEEQSRAAGVREVLVRALEHGTSDTPPCDRIFVLSPIAIVIPLSTWLGPALAQALNLADLNGHYDAWEIILWILTATVGVAITAAAWWMVPPVQFLDQGQGSRFQRFRTIFLGSVSAIIVSVIAAFIYDAFR